MPWKIKPSPDSIHVYPTDDFKEHYLESVSGGEDGFSDAVPPYCPCLCMPKTESENGVWIIIHQSFDGREAVEWVNEILK